VTCCAGSSRWEISVALPPSGVALAATIPAVGILPVGGLALLLGVDRFMSEIRAAGNLTSNIVATLVVARWTGAIDLALAGSGAGGGPGGPRWPTRSPPGQSRNRRNERGAAWGAVGSSGRLPLLNHR
jgi:hypothetical protein